MKKLVSKKIELPVVYFVTDREEIKEISPGVPFIYGDASTESAIVRLLEYETIYQEALKTGYPFNFKKLLRAKGFKDLTSFSHSDSTYMALSVTDVDLSEEIQLEDSMETIKEKWGAFSDYIKDSSVYVDIQTLKNLKVFPIWLEDIEEAVHTNIHNFATFNDNMYNKKLDGMYGGLDLVSPPKNLIVIDISGSIPRGVSATTLALAKNLAETFYADLVITGSKSTLYEYEKIHELNINSIYEENGMDNDQVYFRKLVTDIKRSYKTAIVFGDNHNPGYAWSNKYNRRSGTISRADGKKICKWEVDQIISFHTSTHKGEENPTLAGYAEWFSPKKETKHIADWVKYLNNY